MTSPPHALRHTSAAPAPNEPATREHRPRRATSFIGIAGVLTASLTATLSLPATVSAAPTNGAVDGELLDKASAPTAAEITDITADAEFELDDGLIRASDPPLSHHETDETHEADDEADEFHKAGDDDPTHAQKAVSQAEAFSLHTRPTSGRKIFLDFDGHVTTDTPWNDTSAPIVSGVYSREPVNQRNSTFSQSELDGIVDVWARVAEDFAAWDVDVTTEDPGVDGLSRENSADEEYGVRVIITQDSSWYGPYGGAAYLYSFTRSYDLPAFVFSSNLADGKPKSVAEAVAHEVGHTFGLRHDGIDHSDGTSTPYYSGHGDWAPIMGVGYGKPVTQWSKGEYAGADNTEDDLAMLDEYLERLPDVSASLSLGGTDSVTTHTAVAGGDATAHPLVVTEGPVTVDVTKATTNGNLLATLTIRDSSGAVVATDSPGDPSSWALSATLPASVSPGTYTIEVRSIGWQTPSNGFSSYASVGDYTLGVDVPGSTGPTTPPPDGTTPPATDAGDRFTAISPSRLLDTRKAGSPVDRLRSGERIRVTATTASVINNDATAVVVNVVAVNPSSTGFLSVTPCVGSSIDPNTSSLNYTSRRNTGNSVITALSQDGSFCVDASSATDVIIDVTGWIGPDGTTTLSGIGSERIVDTRRGLGLTKRLEPNERTVLPLAGNLDEATSAISINLTAVNPESSGFITVDNCSNSSTQTSSLNFTARETRGNNGVFALNATQSICITSSTATHLTLDVTGQFGAGHGLTFVPADPVRLLDTRDQQRLGAGASAAFDIPGPVTPGGLSLTPAAASVNIAAARHTTAGHVTAWNCGARPETSAVNPVEGAPTANSALVPIAANGRSCLYHATGGDLIVDLNGWWV